MRLWILFGALALLAQPAAAATASSLSEVPALIKTPEAKQFYREQMEGKPPPDRLGLHLPAALTAKAITALLVPGTKAPLNAVGAKPLPGQPDRYIALVCTGGDIPKSPEDERCAEGQSSEAKLALEITLGIIEAKTGAPARLVAQPVTVDGLVDWQHIDLPSAPDALDDAKGDTIRPDEFDGFDLAPYRIAADTPAYGLRGSWMDSYSGGGANYSALYLFAIIDGRLKQVLAVPMSAFKDIAGDWNKDGTRAHDITDAANILVVSAQQTEGHFDLLLKRRTGHARRLYRWSRQASAYRAAGK